MANKLIAGLFIAVGLLNLYPAIGMLGGERLRALYGVSLSDPNLLVLMRHRAVLLGLLGLFLISAAFHAPLRIAALLAGFASMLSYIVLEAMQVETNSLLRKVFVADIAGCIALALAFILMCASHE